MATEKQDFEDLKIITPEGTAAFPHLFEPHSFEASKEPQYSLILVFPPNTDLTELKKICGRAAIRKFGDKDKVQQLIKRGKLRMPWRDGSEYADYGDPFVEGATFITLKTKNAPGVVNEYAKPMMNHMDFWAGCKARASCLAWGYDSMGNQGVTLLLNNVQKTGDGVKLSGRKSAEEEFEAVKKPPKGGAAKDKAQESDDDFGDDDIPF